jgi:hypothetical protein
MQQKDKNKNSASFNGPISAAKVRDSDAFQSLDKADAQRAS